VSLHYLVKYLASFWLTVASSLVLRATLYSPVVFVEHFLRPVRQSVDFHPDWFHRSLLRDSCTQITSITKCNARWNWTYFSVAYNSPWVTLHVTEYCRFNPFDWQPHHKARFCFTLVWQACFKARSPVAGGYQLFYLLLGASQRVHRNNSVWDGTAFWWQTNAVVWQYENSSYNHWRSIILALEHDHYTTTSHFATCTRSLYNTSINNEVRRGQNAQTCS